MAWQQICKKENYREEQFRKKLEKGLIPPLSNAEYDPIVFETSYS